MSLKAWSMNWFTSLANPQRFLALAKWMLPIVTGLAIVSLVVGSVWGLMIAPEDRFQGAAARMMYVHVPAAWMSMATYGLMAIASLIGYIWRHQLADFAAREAAPMGLVFTLLALLTGSLWGKTTWGVWWDWDARMTSMLVLAFIYAGYITLWRVIDNEAQAARLAAILCMIGAINIPIIKFSVDFWETLHQKSSIIRDGGPAMPASMYMPLLLMALGYSFLFGALLIMRLQTVIWHKRHQPVRPASRPVSVTATPQSLSDKNSEAKSLDQ